MALYLVQHGKSLAKEIDPEQDLSGEGAVETERMARMARDLGLRIGSILHSGKTRARRTAEVLATALQPAAGIKEAPGLNPLDDPVPWTSVNPGAGLMLVGHLPFMGRLAALLVTGSPDKPVIRFQNSGIVCLDRDEASANWLILWALVPKLGV
jgi:phosphohistidine phosphatase